MYDEPKICVAKHCNVSADVYHFRTYLCYRHMMHLRLIRNKIYSAKKINDLKSELHWRLEEIEFRKFTDFSHLKMVGILKKMIDRKYSNCQPR